MSSIKYPMVLFCLAGLWCSGEEPNPHDFFFADLQGVALDGYSPVSYFQRGKAEKGKPEFSVTHHGITYYLTDAAQVKLFNKDPDRYEPTHGGWCSTMIAGSGNRVRANPETFKIAGGRLLLFFDQEVRGNRVNGLDIWNERGGDEAQLPKADQQWAAIVAGKLASRVIDVDAPQAETSPSQPQEHFPVWAPGASNIDGTRIEPFSATYLSQGGASQIEVAVSSDLQGRPTLHVQNRLRYPNAIIEESFVLDQKTMEMRYCFRPMILGQESYYFVGLFEGKKFRGSRTYLLQDLALPVTWALEQPVFEPQLSAFVLATASLVPGEKGRLPTYSPGDEATHWLVFVAKPHETVTLKNGSRQRALPVVFDEGTKREETVWLIDEPPYLIKRQRMVNGSPVASEWSPNR